MNVQKYEAEIIAWVTRQMVSADAGHGIDHIRRVVLNATRISLQEKADLDIVLPAAWLHDCVVIPKNSPLRTQASRLAAESARSFLHSIHYPSEFIPAISHCIEAHSFSANIPCESLEARVLQDADRLEAIGAIGIARCLMTGGAMKQRLYDPDEPFPLGREPRDDRQSIDHFFTKLLKLSGTMQTCSGRQLADERSRFMAEFLFQLANELGQPRSLIKQAINQVSPDSHQ